MTIITDPRCTEYRAAGHPEKPMRVSRTTDLLRTQKALALDWADPGAVTDEQLLRAHSAGHLERLTVAQAFDGDTPHFPGIGEHARRSAGGAIRAVELARGGDLPFCLLRPPGHHATRHHAMGFCYLSSMAIAALEAKASGTRQVAVLDFDVHHGNGTEDILAGVAGVAFASVHQHPGYPGTGMADVAGNCFNFPLPGGTPREQWRATLSRAIDRLKATKPDLLGVSAGFDAYVEDPLAQGTLEKEDFHWLGRQMREFGVPVFSILEGGYSLDLPELVLHYLLGLAGK